MQGPHYMALLSGFITGCGVSQCCGAPRFYFLGDDDLLEVLGQGASLSVIQPHLKKLFAGIHRVRGTWCLSANLQSARQLAICGGCTAEALHSGHCWAQRTCTLARTDA